MTLNEKLDLVKEKFKEINGFDVQGPRLHYLTARFDAYYMNEFGEKDRVRIDLYLPNSTPHSAKRIEPMLVQSQYLLKDPCILPGYSREDLISQKLRDIENRTEGKDIYDLFFSLKMDNDVNAILLAIEKRLELRDDGRSPRKFLEDLEKRRDVFLKDRTAVMNNTNHYIPKKRRPEWRSFINTVFDEILMIPRSRKQLVIPN
ncbi:MAG: nucleotidyl transferase AbiEii/AbiGii toxin family protein [Candidatus Thermoplasmatota archaeon]|nr:nucleotidyl transferase AbiEii/AbiGii toxin family protein [Candidatus Thermoplasmatota archaeon]